MVIIREKGTNETIHLISRLTSYLLLPRLCGIIGGIDRQVNRTTKSSEIDAYSISFHKDIKESKYKTNNYVHARVHIQYICICMCRVDVCEFMCSVSVCTCSYMCKQVGKSEVKSGHLPSSPSTLFQSLSLDVELTELAQLQVHRHAFFMQCLHERQGPELKYLNCAINILLLSYLPAPGFLTKMIG